MIAPRLAESAHDECYRRTGDRSSDILAAPGSKM